MTGKESTVEAVSGLDASIGMCIVVERELSIIVLAWKPLLIDHCGGNEINKSLEVVMSFGRLTSSSMVPVSPALIVDID